MKYVSVNNVQVLKRIIETIQIALGEWALH